MGYYAETQWDVTFRDAAAMEAAKKDPTAALGREWDNGDAPWLSNVGEWATEVGDYDPLVIFGNTSGKYFTLNGGDDALDILAKHATGTVDVDGTNSGDGYYRYVLKDGKVKVLRGRIVYDDEA